MAIRIPRYQQQIAAPSVATPTVRGIPAVEDPTGAALYGIGVEGQRISERIRREQEIEDEKKRRLKERQEVEDAKLEAHKVLSDARLAWTEQMLQAKEKAGPGAANFTPDVLKRFDEYSTKAIGERPSQITQKLLQEGFQNLRTQLGQDALNFEAQARVDNKVNSIEAGLNKAAQAVLTDPRQRAITLNEQMAYIGSMDIPPKVKEALKERALQSIDSAALGGEINRARDNPSALDAILDKMGKGEYPGAPASQLAVAENRILGYKARIEAQQETARRRAEHNAERRQREAEKAFSGAVDLVQAGKVLAPEYIEQLTAQLSGTAYANSFRELVRSPAQTVAFVSQTLPAQQAELQRLAAQGNDPKQGWRPEDLKRYKRMEAAHRTTLADLDANPLNAALERGVVAELPQVDVSSPQALAKTLPARLETARAVSHWAGREVSPLQPDEAKALAAQLESLPAATRAQALADIGKRIGSPARMRALAAQMGDKSPSMATAALLGARELETDKGRSAAEIYLKGVDAIREKRVGFDELKQSKVREEIRRKIDGAYASEAATRAAADAAFNIYAGLMAEGSAGDVKQAVNIATGGIMDYNGGRLAKPYGWSDSKVRDAVRAVTPQRVQALAGEELRLGDERLSPEAFAQALPRARLMASPRPGAYAVVVGGRMVLTASGRPFYLPLEAR